MPVCEHHEDLCATMARIETKVDHSIRLLEGTNGEKGLRILVDRLQVREGVRDREDEQRASVRVRVVSAIIVAIILAGGGFVWTAVASYQTGQQVQALVSATRAQGAPTSGHVTVAPVPTRSAP